MKTCLFLSVSKADDPSGLELTAIVFSYAPVAFACMCLLASLFNRTLRPVMYLSLSVVSTALVYVIKTLLEDCRPWESACEDFGMPSGQSALAVGWLTMLSIDSFIKVNGYAPLNHKIPILLSSFLMLAPVPFSRYYIGDSYGYQVAAGALVGLFTGALWISLAVEASLPLPENQTIV